jgi:hypothetical protein
MKTFSLDEAQALLPVLESLLKRAIDARTQAADIELELQQLARHVAMTGGAMVNVVKIARQRALIEEHIQTVKESLEEMNAIGVQVKDLETGLLDFPCRIDGETVLLCWRMGEDSITHWHTVDSGFRGRQPIDERFRRKTSKPN